MSRDIMFAHIKHHKEYPSAWTTTQSTLAHLLEICKANAVDKPPYFQSYSRVPDARERIEINMFKLKPSRKRDARINSIGVECKERGTEKPV